MCLVNGGLLYKRNGEEGCGEGEGGGVCEDDDK